MKKIRIILFTIILTLTSTLMMNVSAKELTDEELWNKFVETYEKNDTVLLFKENYKDKFKLTKEKNKLIIDLEVPPLNSNLENEKSQNTGKTEKIKAEISFDKGIINYKTISVDDGSFVELFVVNSYFVTVCDMNNIDATKLHEEIKKENRTDYTIEKDGFEFKTKDNHVEYYKVNLREPFKNFKNVQKDIFWEKFINSYKNTKEVKEFEANNGSKIIVDYNYKKLSVAHSVNDDTSITEFTYENGILTYKSGKFSTVEEDSFWIINALYAYADMNGKQHDYYTKKINNEKLSLKDDKFIIKVEEKSLQDTNEILVLYPEFRLVVNEEEAKNHITENDFIIKDKKENDDKKENGDKKVNNPKTNDSIGKIGFGFLGLLVLSIISYKKIKNK